MKKTVKFATASALALTLASPLFAQATLVGTEALNTRIDDITRDVNTENNRGNDALRFSNNGVQQGWKGSFAFGGSATRGTSPGSNLAGAGRLTYGVNDWNHSFGFAIERSKTAGVKTQDDVFGTYEANRFFTPKFYLFGIGRVEHDSFATNKTDAFLGFGPGYRIINNDKMAWRVQAGPGIRYTKTNAAPSVSATEAGFIASSRFYWGLTDTVSITNDTDVLGSKASTISTNDLGVNFKVSDNLSTRVSYRTKYNDLPNPTTKPAQNTLGFSVVLGF